MAKNELLPFADGEDANVLPTNQWEALTDILENGFQSGIARSEQVNRVLAQGAVASFVLGQLVVDKLNKDATLDKSALYQNLILALQENAKDACLPLSGGNVTGNLTVQGKNVVRSVNGSTADASGNVAISIPNAFVTETYRNGSTWYRKWSDGFIEQGGTCTANTVVTVTFPVAFASVVLNAWVCAYGVFNDNAEYLKLSSVPTLTSLVARGGYTTPNVYGAMNATGYWYACGY